MTISTKSRKRASKRPPWEKPAPRSSRHTKLTPAKKTKAKRAARKAGRPYPNLVDNMRAAAKGKKKPRIRG